MVRKTKKLKFIIDVNIEDKRWLKYEPKISSKAKQIIKIALSESKAKINSCQIEISLLLTNDKHIQVLNKQYRSKDKPTNVLSFPIDSVDSTQEVICLGDIIVSLETITDEALQQNKDFMNHFSHMLVHGVLHLLGYDHIKPKDAIKMESLEIDILQIMGISNPY